MGVLESLFVFFEMSDVYDEFRVESSSENHFRCCIFVDFAKLTGIKVESSISTFSA